jgi:surfactin synthase thioesterase subunit
MTRVICFHAAGGSSRSFVALRRSLPADIPLTTVTLPGRDLRVSEPRLTDVDACVNLLSEELEDFLDEPYILLGHGLGAVIAYSLAHRWVSSGRRIPEAVIVAACRPPHLGIPTAVVDRLDTSAVSAALILSGALPTSVLTRQRRTDALLGLVRDDLRIQSSFGDRPVSPLPCPLHIFGGIGDDLAPPELLVQWNRYSVSPQPLRLLGDGHFPFREPDAEVVAAICDVVHADGRSTRWTSSTNTPAMPAARL